MGLFKKSDDGDDSNRRALFGRKNKSPAPPANPYAKPIPTNPYTKAKIEAGVAPLPASQQPVAGDKSPAATATAPIAAPAGPPAGYAPNKYGNQGGYGTDRFGGGGGGASSRPGGYGGLGSDPNDPGDANRDALFGGARERVQQQQPGAPPPYEEGGNAAGGAYGGYGGGSNDYNNVYQERQLTAEEEEEEEIQAIKQEMRFVKQGDVASTRNALRVAAQAEETGRETLARLGAQGETIHDTERNLDLATIEGRVAQDKARELKTLNKSMFHVHVANPFTASRRRREREELVLNTHRQDRETREGTRSEAYQANQRLDRTFREIEKEAKRPVGKARTNVAERAKYQFEADSEDEGMEDEIEQNLDLLHGAAGRLNGLARATGREIDEQNRHLERIAGKSDFVDDQLAMNRDKLDRIR
ncbi:putative plasma membrane SNARE protein (Sec9) [Aspergillus chevalieri]|uniref:Protein transport protein SEC9 n=1 Tax=Aspergillus chevalieri TaxID=182096 RepID=A0A7R7VRQ0_ASPCH|nr:meiosis-specific subunit of the t-SNARE complex [Aspergillus chevalieri]BCR89591.1 meiosis-specific subunit of the t-SNARE complex [Aspergillus chevalieri]